MKFEIKIVIKKKRKKKKKKNEENELLPLGPSRSWGFQSVNTTPRILVASKHLTACLLSIWAREQIFHHWRWQYRACVEIVSASSKMAMKGTYHTWTPTSRCHLRDLAIQAVAFPFKWVKGKEGIKEATVSSVVVRLMYHLSSASATSCYWSSMFSP